MKTLFLPVSTRDVQCGTFKRDMTDPTFRVKKNKGSYYSPETRSGEVLNINLDKYGLHSFGLGLQSLTTDNPSKSLVPGQPGVQLVTCLSGCIFIKCERSK